LAVENHINYIHKPEGTRTIHEAFGIAATLNTSIVDGFFRSFNGSTQVNASEIRSMPFPDIEQIRTIGKAIYESQTFHAGVELDRKVIESLHIKPDIIGRLNGSENEQDY
jgi:adenine-specific DNA-methyltransferase